MAEHISIRSCMFIGQGYHWPTRRFLWIWHRLAPTGKIVADAPSCEYTWSFASGRDPANKTQTIEYYVAVKLSEITALKSCNISTSYVGKMDAAYAILGFF